MNALEIFGWVIGSILYLFLCRAVYLLGYGRTPRDVCEPVKVLSTGERNPNIKTGEIDFRPGAINRYEDLTDALTILEPSTPYRNLICIKRDIESAVGSNE